MKDVRTATRFRRDLECIAKRGWDLGKLEVVINLLRQGEVLDERYRDHGLADTWSDFRECVHRARLAAHLSGQR